MKTNTTTPEIYAFTCPTEGCGEASFGTIDTVLEVGTPQCGSCDCDMDRKEPLVSPAETDKPESLDAYFTAEEKKTLMESFIGNELETDEHQAWPGKGLNYLSVLLSEGPIKTEPILDALLAWITAWNDEGRGTYAGADAARPLLVLAFEGDWDRGRTPYHDGVHAVERHLRDLNSA